MMTGIKESNSGVWRLEAGPEEPAEERLARISVGGLIMLCWVLFALAMLSGCVTQSVHPIYDDETLVFEPELLGRFGDEDGVWTFTQNDSSSYLAAYVDNRGVEAHFDVHLAEIDGTVFLDLTPDEWPDEANEILGMNLLPVHWFFRVDELDQSLKISAMDPEWLEDYLADFPQLIEHTIVDGRVLLTADTEQLQAFICAEVNNADAWYDPEEFVRIPETRR